MKPINIEGKDYAFVCQRGNTKYYRSIENKTSKNQVIDEIAVEGEYKEASHTKHIKEFHIKKVKKVKIKEAIHGS